MTPISNEQWLMLWMLSMFFANVTAGNLTCYQCIKNNNEECGQQHLLPCSSVSDRCVTHIIKNAEQGFKIKRECGLGPCGFEDVAMNKGLGWTCDRSKDEYFCVYCCRESGCNKSSALQHKPTFLITVTLLLIVMLTIFQRFQVPYVLKNDDV